MTGTLTGAFVYLDSNVPIYLLRGEGRHFERADAVMNALRRDGVIVVIGDAVVSEVMVGAYKSNDPVVQDRTRAFLEDTGLFTVRSHDASDFDLAARLRAMYRIAFVDALHIATAMNAGCTALITNDKRLGDINGLDILQLADVA